MSRSKAFRIGLLVPLLFTLGACRQQPPKPAPLDFESDLRILRGVWTGADGDGNTLRLAVRAGPTSEEGFYEINGVFELDEDGAYAFRGSVAASTTPSTGPYALSPQVSPT